MKLSILTATYNRANLLERLYASIVNNIFNELDVEWLIMDDGSTDNTQEVVSNFENMKHLSVQYYKQENQGKMQAINNLMEYVTGELVMECDSDDYFLESALKKIYTKSEILFKDNDLYGLIFLKNETKTNLSGNKFTKENVKTTMFDMYFKDGILGEKVIVFRTDIRKKYKHELEGTEKFVTEARMYHKMDLDYRVKCYNEVIVEGMYLKDGYTSNINKTFFECPNGYFKYFEEILGRDFKNVKINKTIYAIKHYILFSYITKQNIDLKKVKNNSNKLIIILLYFPGVIKSRMLISKETAKFIE